MMLLRPTFPPKPAGTRRAPYSVPPSPELGELDPDTVRVLDVRIAAPGLLHLQDHRMARLLRLRERGVEVLDREGEVVQPLSDLVGCVEPAAPLVVIQLEGIAALSFANEFNDGPPRRINRVPAAHLHPEEVRVELHRRVEILHADSGVEELPLHGLGTMEVRRRLKPLAVTVFDAENLDSCS